MCAQNGPSLHLGSELCWSKELQIFSPFSGTTETLNAASLFVLILHICIT